MCQWQISKIEFTVKMWITCVIYCWAPRAEAVLSVCCCICLATAKSCTQRCVHVAQTHNTSSIHHKYFENILCIKSDYCWALLNKTSWQFYLVFYDGFFLQTPNDMPFKLLRAHILLKHSLVLCMQHSTGHLIDIHTIESKKVVTYYLII